ncbi:cellulose binding domain-containing protein [Streptomyces sp. NRRL S-350]|uniref:cellulose binding domain-containing protein n=1 Tax=Streptomyces sp. NRRL S-350 TaxID=1463902 RepID=UPI0004C2418A|nr:cellulose binding domain-containing protein [Streptomyces sp. NRRL S-350]
MRTSAQTCREHVIAVVAALSLAVTGAIAAVAPPATATPSATTSTVSVSVDAALQLATVPATGVGVNIPVYDANMNAAATPGLLGTAGINTVRYPGGSHSDAYHWQSGTTDDGSYVAPNTGFDAFMGTVRAAGAQPIITANYGSGTPQEAADWVRYANVTKGYGIRYWEIGNEVYGNGEYGAKWEHDTHSSKSATTYANNLLQYIAAMKAADPSVKIGAVLVTPGYWPDGMVGPGDTTDWNHTVMSIAGSKIDFAIVHAYPTSTSPADLLTKPQAQNAGITGAVRSLINQYAGTNAPNVGIAVTEANAQAYLDTSPNGLFAPDNYLTWLENGAFNVDWWDLRNGTDCTKVTTVEGATDYNDGGMVSSGSPCEPAVNTPFPAYYGIQMISRLGTPGDTLVKAASSSALLSAHAVRRADGDVDVMLINKDPNNDATVNLSYTGFTPSSATPTVHSYLKNAHGIGTAQSGSPTGQTVPAYGITVVQMHPTGAACRVVYNKNEWSGVMVGNLTVVNNGLGQVNGWNLGFTFPGDTTITNSWNASVSQSGPNVNAGNVSYDASVPQGGSVQWGFKATWSTSDANPSAFWFNGASCAIG